MQTITVTVPPDASPGQQLTVQHGTQQIRVQIPAGVSPGQQLQVQVPAAAAQPNVMNVQVPAGVKAGDTITVQAPSGVRMQVQIPAGVGAGQTIQVAIPAAPAPPSLPKPSKERAAELSSGGKPASSTDVELQIRFFKIESIETRLSVMRLKVWLRCYWRDPRLAWSPAAHGGIDTLFFAAGSLNKPEDTEICARRPPTIPLQSPVPKLGRHTVAICA